MVALGIVCIPPLSYTLSSTLLLQSEISLRQQVVAQAPGMAESQ